MFENLSPGLYHVGVRAEGYSTRRTEVTVGTTPATLDVVVDFDLHFSEVLSVSPNARPQFESYQATTVLDGQELAKNLEATIGATLSEAPGVAMREFGPGPARPIIRGLDGDRVAVLEDGQRMGDLSSQSGDHAVPTNPAAAKRIEVVRGPATLLYGANAIGGLVNVITDSIPTEQVQGASGNITLNFGTNGGAAGGARRHPCRGAAISRCTSAARAPVPATTARRRARWTIPMSRTAMGQVGASWVGDKSYVGASYGYDDTKYGIPVVEEGQISLTPKRHSFSARAGGQNLDGWLQSYRATIGVRRYEHSELEGTEIGTTFNNDTVEGEVLLSHRRTGRLVGSVGGLVPQSARSRRWAPKPCRRPSISRRPPCSSTRRSSRRTPRCSSAADSTTPRTSPRADCWPRDFNEFSGSVGLLLKPQAANDNLVLALNVARAARYPALEELYYFGPHPGNLAFEIGNDALDAEHALGFDVSLRGRGRRFEGEVTFFRNDINNYIFRQPTGEIEEEFPVVENVAADSVLMGVEAHGDVKVTSELTAEVTYDWVRGELKESGDPLPRIPPYRVLGGAALPAQRLSGRRRPAGGV